ncbi:hypothetical protein CS8_099460 [Cupriavidus sp. 8B]
MAFHYPALRKPALLELAVNVASLASARVANPQQNNFGCTHRKETSPQEAPTKTLAQFRPLNSNADNCLSPSTKSYARRLGLVTVFLTVYLYLRLPTNALLRGKAFQPDRYNRALRGADAICILERIVPP